MEWAPSLGEDLGMCSAIALVSCHRPRSMWVRVCVPPRWAARQSCVGCRKTKKRQKHRDVDRAKQPPPILSVIFSGRKTCHTTWLIARLQADEKKGRHENPCENPGKTVPADTTPRRPRSPHPAAERTSLGAIIGELCPPRASATHNNARQNVQFMMRLHIA